MKSIVDPRRSVAVDDLLRPEAQGLSRNKMQRQRLFEMDAGERVRARTEEYKMRNQEFGVATLPR
jgi:hypothetical protein